MSRARVVIEKFAEWMALVGGFVVFLMMLMVAVDAVGRKVASSLPGALEFSEAFMVPAVFLPLMFVQLRREHVFVGVVTDWLSPRSRAFLDGLASLVGIVIFGFLSWLALDKAIQAFAVGEYRIAVISVPIWPYRWIIPFGTGLMVLQLTLHAIEDFGRAFGAAEPSQRADATPF